MAFGARSARRASTLPAPMAYTLDWLLSSATKKASVLAVGVVSGARRGGGCLRGGPARPHLPLRGLAAPEDLANHLAAGGLLMGVTALPRWARGRGKVVGHFHAEPDLVFSGTAGIVVGALAGLQISGTWRIETHGWRELGGRARSRSPDEERRFGGLVLRPVWHGGRRPHPRGACGGGVRCRQARWPLRAAEALARAVAWSRTTVT